MRIRLCLLMLICTARLIAAVPQTAGLHESLPCIDNPAYTIDLLLPAGYDAAGDQTYPVFFLSSPGGDPNLKDWRSWADARGFIVVALNNSKNGPWGPIVTNQDLAWKSLEAWAIKAHHCLRYAGGFSGAAWASVKFAQRYPDQFAGVHLSGHSGNGDYAPKHVAIAIFAGLKDDTQPWSGVQGAIRTYESNGNVVTVQTHAGGHKGADAAVMSRQVDWLYLQTVLSHPGLTKEDRLAGEAWVGAERQRILTMEDRSARVERFEALLAIPAIRASVHGGDLLNDWGSAVVASLDGAGTVGEFWAIFAASQQPWFKKLDRDLRKELGNRLKELKKDDAVKPEYRAWGAYQQAEAMAAKANTEKKQAAVADAFRQIAEAFPETRYGRLAAERG